MILKNDQPGYWEFTHHPEAGSYMHFNCPCGCPYLGAVAVRRESEPKRWEIHWIWNGDEKLPTLSPSLRRGTPCKFHGFLKCGVWEACTDGATLAPNVYSGRAS